MTLNGVMAVTLRYFTEFGKPVFQHMTASICGGIYARVYCILYRVYDVVVKKVHVRYLIFRWVSCLIKVCFTLDIILRTTTTTRTTTTATTVMNSGTGEFAYRWLHGISVVPTFTVMPIFGRAMQLSAAFATRMSVRLSVCLSHLWVLSHA